MSGKGSYEGGCLCGALRYRAVDPIDAGYCHCRMCQRSSGAPVLAWISFPHEGFTYEKGEPAVYHSSSHSQREFCPGCGTQIAFRDTKKQRTVDVNMASLDDPEAAKPEYHIWDSSRISWFQLADHLPRYEDDGPDRNL